MSFEISATLHNHVARRGDGGAPTYFSDADDQLYRDLPAAHCRAREREAPLRPGVPAQAR